MNRSIKAIFLSFFILSFLSNANGQAVFPWQDSLTWFHPKEKVVLKNKPVILEFWATWCSACVEAIPHLNQLTAAHHNEIDFISVNSYDSKKRINSFLEKQEINSFLVSDLNKHLYNQFEVQNIPVTILLDTKGNIRYRGHPHNLTSEMLTKFISKDSISLLLPKSGTLIDTIMNLPNKEGTAFSFKLSYGDLTKGKQVSFPTNDQFLFNLNNFAIESIIERIYKNQGINIDWRFEGNRPRRIGYNIYSEAASKENEKLIYQELSKHLAKILDFSIVETEEMQEVWFLEAALKQQKELISKDDSSDSNVYKDKNHLYFNNVNLEFLNSLFSQLINTKVICNFDPQKRYSLNFKETYDVQEFKSILKNKYDINLAQKKVMVKVHKLIFH